MKRLWCLGIATLVSACGSIKPIAPADTLEQQLASAIAQFAQTDEASPPGPCQVLFVGSSSIAAWRTLAQDMAPVSVINRGFGGSHIEYVTKWFDRVVTPYRPGAIVLYAGENDIAAGKPVDRVVADFDAFMVRKNVALGQVPVYFISVKPSKSRFEQFGLQSQVNDAIRARADQRADLYYIDVAAAMLENGRPKDIFVADNLHMTPQGYAIWTQAVRAALLSHGAAEARHCH